MSSINSSLDTVVKGLIWQERFIVARCRKFGIQHFLWLSRMTGANETWYCQNILYDGINIAFYNLLIKHGLNPKSSTAKISETTASQLGVDVSDPL